MSLSLDLADLSRAVGRTVSTYDVEAIDPHLRIDSVSGGCTASAVVVSHWS